jgi:hypothetical protein
MLAACQIKNIVAFMGGKICIDVYSEPGAPGIEETFEILMPH